MKVKKVEWRSGELEIVFTDKEEEVAMSIAHTLGHYLSVIVGARVTEDYIAALWELKCLVAKDCYLCIRLPTDKSVCLDVSDPDVIKRVLRKILQQLKQVKNKEVAPIVDVMRKYIEDVLREVVGHGDGNEKNH